MYSETNNPNIYPTLYSNSTILSEFCGERFQFCQYHNVVELVGIAELSWFCQSDNIISRKAASAAIEKFNRQHQTRLTYDCVKNLTPMYAYAPILDPCVFTDNLYAFKKAATNLLRNNERPENWSDASFSQVNLVMQNIDLTGIGTLIVHYPNPHMDKGFWVVYWSQDYTENHPIPESIFAMNKFLPIEGIPYEVEKSVYSYALPPEEESSLIMAEQIDQAVLYYRHGLANTGNEKLYQ